MLVKQNSKSISTEEAINRSQSGNSEIFLQLYKTPINTCFSSQLIPQNLNYSCFKNSKNRSVPESMTRNSTSEDIQNITTVNSRCWNKFSKVICIFYRDSFSLGQILMNEILSIFINYIYFGFIGDENIQASFGIGLSYYFFVFNSLNSANFEITRTECSIKYNKRKYSDLSQNLLAGLFYQFQLSIWILLLFYFCKPIMDLIKINPENSSLAQKMLVAMIPGVIIKGFNEQIKSFLLAINANILTITSSIISISINAVIGYFLIVKYDYGILSFAYCQVLSEIIIQIVQTQILQSRIRHITFTKPKFDKLKAAIKSRISDFTKKTLFCYIEVLGFELNTYLICLSHNNTEIAAYVCLTNIAQIYYSLSQAFGIVNRSIVGNTISWGKIDEARFKFWFNLFLIWVIAIVFMICLLFMPTKISYAYSNSKDVIDLLSSLIFLYSFCGLFEFSNGSLKIILIQTNNYSTLLIFQIGYMIIMQTTFGILLCYKFEQLSKGQIFSNFIVSMMFNGTMTIKTNRLCWEDIFALEQDTLNS